MAKQRSADSTRKPIPSLSDVLRAAGRPEVRSYAVTLFRKQGILAPGEMLTTGPWSGLSAEVARCLSRTEDWLELTHPKWPERESIRGVRRRLEGAQ